MTQPKKKFIEGDLGLRRSGTLDIAGLRDLAQAHPEHFMRKCEDLIAEKKIGLRKIPDLQAFFRAFVDVKVKADVDLFGTRASVDTSAFPLLMGNMVVAEINAAYEAVPTVGQDLVRDMDSNKKIAHLVKMTGLVHNNLRTKEGDEFPMISAGEEFATVNHNRKGFQLSITQETLEENDIGNFIDLIDQGGEFAAEVIEELTLSRVCDQQGSATSPAEPYVYHKGGTATQLYTTTANSPSTQTPSGTRVNNNALVSTTNLEAARAILAGNLNTRGKRIAIPMSETVLLVPDALVGTAAKLLNSELEPGVDNEVNNWGPRGRYRPMLRSTPKLDDISTTAWYLGAFQRQFVRKWKIRLETVSVYADAMQYARTREAYRTRVAWDVEVGARDHVFVVQNLSATTAPTAATSNI